jgi:hypothetical protein
MVVLAAAIGVGALFKVARADDERGMPGEKDTAVSGLIVRAKELLKEKKPDAAKCRQLAVEATKRYTAATANDRTDTPEWLELQALLGSHFPQRTRDAMASDLYQRHWGSQKAIANLTLSRLLASSKALAALGRPVPAERKRSWMVVSSRYKDLSLLGLRDLAWALGVKWAPRHFGRAIAIQVSEILEEGRLGPESIEVIGYLAYALGPSLTDAQRHQWRRCLLRSFKGMPLEMPQLERLLRIMRSLKDQRTGDIVAAWLDRQRSLASLDIGQLCMLASYLQGSSASEKSSRDRLTGHILAKYLSSDASARSLSSGDWGRLVGAFGKQLTPGQRRRWVQHLIKTRGNVKLTWAEFRALLGQLEGLGGQKVRFARDWIAGNECWKSWPVKELAGLWGVFSGPGTQAASARRQLVDHVSAKYLVDDETIRSRPPGDWHYLGKHIGRQAPEDVRAAWRDKLRRALVCRQLKPYELMSVLGALRFLGDQQRPEFIREWMAWMDVQGSWQTWRPGRFVSMVFWAFRGRNEDFKPVGLELALRTLHANLVDDARIRSVSCTDWMRLARAFAKDMPSELTRRWAARLWEVIRGPGDTLFTDLKPKDRTELVSALGYLGAGSLVSVVIADEKSHRSHVALVGQESANAGLWRDWAWPLLFWRVLAAEPRDRQDRWDREVYDLPRNARLPALEILASLRATLDEAFRGQHAMNKSDLLEDLACVARDAETKEALLLCRAAHEREAYAGSLPPKLRDMVQRVAHLAKSARTEERKALAARIIEIGQKTNRRKLVLLGRQDLLAVLLRGSRLDVKATERQLKELLAEADTARASSTLWNLMCRAQLRRLAQAEPAHRRGMWAKATKTLVCEGPILFARTLRALDNLLGVLEDDDPDLAHRVLGDLLLLAPNISSMRDIQFRRAGLLARQKNWPDAKAAALLGVILSDTTSSRLSESINQCITIMKSAGAVGHDRLAFESWIYGPGAGRRKAGSGKARQGPPVVDRRLQAVAQKALRDAPIDTPLRRKAYLHLFAGRPVEALKLIHRALRQARGLAIRRGLDDVAIVAAATEGSLAGGSCFAVWIATGQPPAGGAVALLAEAETSRRIGASDSSARSQPADARWADLSDARKKRMSAGWLRHRASDLARTGAIGLGAGNGLCAGSCWARALNERPPGLPAGVVINAILGRAAQLESSRDLLKSLAVAGRRVRAGEDRREFLTHLARLCLARQAFAQCIATLDEIHATSKARSGQEGFSLAVLRARSLIALKKHEEALAVLETWRRSTLPDEDSAQVRLMIGWIHLARNDTAKAITAFQEVVTKYPVASFAAEARRIVLRLKSRSEKRSGTLIQQGP